MGNSRTMLGQGRELNESHRLSFLRTLLYFDFSNLNPPLNPTMEQKITAILLNFIFSTGYGMVILLNIQDIKGWILFGIAVLYGIARLLFYCIKQNHERKMRDLEYLEKARLFKGKRQ